MKFNWVCWLQDLVGSRRRTRFGRQSARHRLRLVPRVAALESRLAPAVTAAWNAFSNTLTITVTGGDTAVVTTKGGSDVSVLDQFAAEILVDTLPTSSVQVIDITSTAGSNQIDLSGLDPALYADTNLLVGIDGSAAGDALVTGGEDQNFDFGSANGGIFEPRGAGAGGTGSFNDIATVTSAGGNDQFHFDDAGSISGSVTAGSGSDTLTFAGRFTPVSIVANDKATSVKGNASGGISGFESFVTGEDNDSLDANLSGAGVVYTLDGQGGDDAFVLSYKSGLTDDAVTIADSGGGETLNFAGTEFGVIVDMDSSGAQDLDGAGTEGDTLTLPANGVVESATGTAFDDEFSVDGRAAGNPRTIVGGGQTTADTIHFAQATSPAFDVPSPAGLILNYTGPGAGSISGLNPIPPGTFGPMDFSGTEVVDVSLSGDITLNGSTGNDTLTVNATSNDDGAYTLSFDSGAFVFSGSLTDVTKLTFNADDGTDLLSVENNVFIFSPVNGVRYDGGTGVGYALEMFGTGGAAAGRAETYQVGVSAEYGNGATAGTIDLTGGADALNLQFTGLAPVTDDVPAATLDVYATDAADTIGVTDDGTRVKAAVTGFEAISFKNKPSVTVHGGDLATPATGDAADGVTVNFTVVAGMTDLTISGEDGDDTVTVRSIPVSTTVNGDTGDDSIQAGNVANQLDDINATLSVNGGGATLADTLIIEDSGTVAGNAYDVTGTAVTRGAPVDVTVNYSAVETMTLNTGDDTVTATDPAAVFTLSTGAGSDSVTVVSTTADATVNTGDIADTVNVRAVGTATTTTVNAGDGSDTVNAGNTSGSLDDIDGTLTVHGQGVGADTDVLAVDDSGDTGADTYDVTAGSVTRGRRWT